MPLSDQLARIETAIRSACQKAGRERESVHLIAVTKNVPLPLVQEAYDLGLRSFGESRLQEALPKISSLPSDVEWHFIGSLQSNKAKRIAELFSVIHTFCKPSQLVESAKANRSIDAFIEVNIGNEPQKSGLNPDDLDAYHQLILNYPHVRFRGLMTIGPATIDSEGMRPYFRRLKELNESVGGRWLSMGMSGDFDVAIQEGATHIRVGSALFGARQ